MNPDDPNQGNVGGAPGPADQGPQTCVTCGGPSANGTCTNCSQPNAGCTCPPAAPTGGQDEGVGGGMGGPGPGEPPTGPSVPPAA